MSRCFPFPPPGYEKKTRTDDLDLLKKEKQKEKKHKKEKKDKEKREGKERREKDKSDGKHREKKDKKEKSRDKKKDKDRDRDKDKSSNLEEKRLPGHFEGHDKEKISTEKRLPGLSESHNGEKVSNEKRSAGKSEGHNGEGSSCEKRLPLQSESHGGEKFIPKEEQDKIRNNFSNERISAGQFTGYNGEKISQSIPLATDAKDSKFAQELDRRVREECRGAGNRYADRVTVSDQKIYEGAPKPLSKAATVNGARGTDIKDKKGDDRKNYGQGIRGDTRFSGNSIFENFTEVVQTRVEGLDRPSETNIERKMEGKEKAKEKGNDDKRRDKRKDKDKEKKSQGKDRDRSSKERKKEEKAKEKKENKTLELDHVKESIKNDILGTQDVKTPYLSEDGNKNAASEGILRKRKDTETNGFLHADENRPNKLPRPTLSHSLSKNGRILDPCQSLIPIDSDKQGAATTLKVDGKGRKLNGIVEALPASMTKLPSVTAQANPFAEAARILPHPDSKYLSQILSVPKIEELPDFDEQDWLSSSNNTVSKKCKLDSSKDDETPMVWSEALRIESADVYALPYVIPY